MKRPRYVRGRKYYRRSNTLVLRMVTIRVLVLVGMLGCIAAGLSVYKLYPTVKAWYDESIALAEGASYSDFQNTQTGYIYDNDGAVLLTLKQDKDIAYVYYDDLPEGVIHAFVAIEDKRFYQHSGVDWASTAKAGVLLVAKHGEIVRGGSTITQQLARNVYLSFEQSFERKFKEIVLALELEKKYSKEQILEFYVNNINYGNGYYGIGAAARGYFNCDVSELSYEEIAFLCAIPNNPTCYDPVVHFDNTIRRRNVILQQMYVQGYLGREEYLASCNSACHVVERDEAYNDFAASYSLECAIRELMKADGFKFKYKFDSMSDYEEYSGEYETAYSDAKFRLYTGGYVVETSLDLGMQAALQKRLNSELKDFKEKTNDGIYRVQGAATVIDNKTGLVVASIGGRTSKGKNNYLALNRAFQSTKQPGSTIKPLIVYTPSLENGYTVDSIVHDVPIEDGPKNAGNSYLGDITLRTAVEKSKNVVAWQLYDELTPEVGLSYLSKMQFKSVVPDDYYLPSSLGGFTYGVTTEEMAGAYSALENGGVWREPTCIVSIKNQYGDEVYAGQKKKRVYDKFAAWDMVNVLAGVSESGTARGLTLENGQKFACKTGTTNDNRVGWFCGFTPQYSIAVYVGADVGNESIEGLQGATYPARIWKGMQDFLLRGKKPVKLQGKRPVEKKKNEEFIDETKEQVTPDILDDGKPIETVDRSVEEHTEADESIEEEEDMEEPTGIAEEAPADSTEAKEEEPMESTETTEEEPAESTEAAVGESVESTEPAEEAPADLTETELSKDQSIIEE